MAVIEARSVRRSNPFRDGSPARPPDSDPSMHPQDVTPDRIRISRIRSRSNSRYRSRPPADSASGTLTGQLPHPFLAIATDPATDTQSGSSRDTQSGSSTTRNPARLTPRNSASSHYRRSCEPTLGRRRAGRFRDRPRVRRGGTSGGTVRVRLFRMPTRARPGRTAGGRSRAADRGEGAHDRYRRRVAVPDG